MLQTFSNIYFNFSFHTVVNGTRKTLLIWTMPEVFEELKKMFIKIFAMQRSQTTYSTHCKGSLIYLTWATLLDSYLGNLLKSGTALRGYAAAILSILPLHLSFFTLLPFLPVIAFKMC